MAPTQVALAWLLHKPAVTAPIVGATGVTQVEGALAAVSLQLSTDELEERYLPHRIVD